jgi:hypothetical protein
MLLQELVRRRGKMQVVELMSDNKIPAATAPVTQSGGPCGGVSAGGGGADHKASYGDDTELDNDRAGNNNVVELIPETAPASLAAQRGSSRYRGVSWDKLLSKWGA